MPESLLDCVRNEVALQLDRGEVFSDVEAQLIDGAPGLDEDERAALWLFAWSYRASARRDAARQSGPVVL